MNPQLELEVEEILLAVIEKILSRHRPPHLRAVFCGVMDAFNDKDSILFAIGTFSDGSQRPLSTTEYAARASIGSVGTSTTTQDQTIPGTSMVIPSGSNVFTYPKPLTDETVTFSWSGFANGVTAADTVVNFVAEPAPTLTSVSTGLFQPSTI